MRLFRRKPRCESMDGNLRCQREPHADERHRHSDGSGVLNEWGDDVSADIARLYEQGRRRMQQ